MPERGGGKRELTLETKSKDVCADNEGSHPIPYGVHRAKALRSGCFLDEAKGGIGHMDSRSRSAASCSAFQ
jgi:hypothetical protein